MAGEASLSTYASSAERRMGTADRSRSSPSFSTSVKHSCDDPSLPNNSSRKSCFDSSLRTFFTYDRLVLFRTRETAFRSQICTAPRLHALKLVTLGRMPCKMDFHSDELEQYRAGSCPVDHPVAYCAAMEGIIQTAFPPRLSSSSQFIACCIALVCFAFSLFLSHSFFIESFPKG